MSNDSKKLIFRIKKPSNAVFANDTGENKNESNLVSTNPIPHTIITFPFFLFHTKMRKATTLTTNIRIFS
jgi:hypothetical protein